MTAIARNIALFIHDLKDGGAQRCFLNLANELSRQGISVHLITLDKGALSDLLDPKVCLHVIGSKRVLFSFSSFNSVVKKIKPDFIITGLLQNNVFLCMYNIVYRYKGKIIVSEHSIPSYIDLSDESFLIKISSKFRAAIYKSANLVIAVSNACKDDLVRNFSIKSNQISVIHNPVINSDFIFENKKDKKSDTLNFCSVGRLHLVKNHRLLLESLSLIKNKLVFKLVILGDGPERNNIIGDIERLGLQDFVELKGFVREPFSIIKNSDLVIVSSKIEGFCNVVIESFACGVPVVSTKCHGPEELIDSDVLGELCDHEPKSMATAILKACSKKYDVKKLHDNSKYYSSENIAKKYLKALEDV